MSIYAYVGLPGSGKSYDTVENQICPALQAGRTVVTNLPLKLDAVRERYPGADIRQFPVDAVLQEPASIFDHAVPGCVLVIDEAWRIWPAGQKAHQVPEPFRRLVAEHRHMVDASGNSMQIVLVVQDLKNIAQFARLLVESTYYHTKLGHLGMSNRYRIDVYHGAVEGQNPPRSARLREIFGTYKPAIFALYETHTMRQSEGSGANEASADTRGNIFKRPMLWVGLVGCIVATAWGIPTVYGYFNPKPKGSTVVPQNGNAPVLEATAGAPVPRSAGSAPAARAAPADLRITGWIQAPEASRSVVLVSGGGVVRRLRLADGCRFGKDNDPSCIVDGWVVTQAGTGPLDP